LNVATPPAPGRPCDDRTLAGILAPFLYTDGQHITGLAMTLWLLSASIFIGFLVSIPLSIARVSRTPLVRWPVQFYTYLFRGTPLYIHC
jgi:histidine transport system permease protein